MSDSNPLNSIREVIGRQKATSKAMAEILSNSPTRHLYADTFYDRLQKSIISIADEIKGREDVQLSVYFDTQAERIVVDYLGFHNPYLMVLYGHDADGNECRVLTHMEATQLIVKIEKVDDKTARRKPIGFRGEIPEKRDAGEP